MSTEKSTGTETPTTKNTQIGLFNFFTNSIGNQIEKHPKTGAIISAVVGAIVGAFCRPIADYLISKLF